MQSVCVNIKNIERFFEGFCDFRDGARLQKDGERLNNYEFNKF
jgi:hypothetical protein